MFLAYVARVDDLGLTLQDILILSWLSICKDFLSLVSWNYKFYLRDDFPNISDKAARANWTHLSSFSSLDELFNTCLIHYWTNICRAENHLFTFTLFETKVTDPSMLYVCEALINSLWLWSTFHNLTNQPNLTYINSMRDIWFSTIQWTVVWFRNKVNWAPHFQPREVIKNGPNILRNSSAKA